MKILITLEYGCEIPAYQTDGAVGVDLAANKILKVFNGDKEIDKHDLEQMQKTFIEEGYVKIRPFYRILFGTGLRVALPKNLEMQIRSRSGMALKKGLFVANQPGTIDPDYRGEVGVIIYNSTHSAIDINYNDRIAQAVFNEVVKPTFTLIGTLDDTERGEGGFGSTTEK